MTNPKHTMTTTLELIEDLKQAAPSASGLDNPQLMVEATTITTLAAERDALRDALEGYARNYLLDEYENPDLCYDDAHRAAVAKLFTTLERTAQP